MQKSPPSLYENFSPAPKSMLQFTTFGLKLINWFAANAQGIVAANTCEKTKRK